MVHDPTSEMQDLLLCGPYYFFEQIYLGRLVLTHMKTLEDGEKNHGRTGNGIDLYLKISCNKGGYLACTELLHINYNSF